MLFKHRRSPHLFAFIAMVNVLTIWVLSTISGNTQVYLRNLLFSEIVSDSGITSEAALDAHMAANFKTDSQLPTSQVSYFNEATMSKLRALKDAGASADKMAKAVGSAI